MEDVDFEGVVTLLAPAGSVPKSKRQSRFGENNGNSYMIVTAIVGGLSPLMIVMAQQAPCLATRIVYTVFAALATIVAALNFLMLAYREWNKQLIELSPKFLQRWEPVFLADVPWRVMRLTDCVCAWTLAIAAVILAFWIWDDSADKNTYFLFCNEHRGCHNIWGAWALSILQSVNYFTAAASDLPVRSVLAMNMASIVSMVAWFVGQLVSVVAIAKGIELLNLQLGDKGQTRRTENGLLAELVELRRREAERLQRKREKRARERARARKRNDGAWPHDVEPQF
jgi:hypothetical protein